jgi:hypothetical protein
VTHLPSSLHPSENFRQSSDTPQISIYLRSFDALPVVVHQWRAVRTNLRFRCSSLGPRSLPFLALLFTKFPTRFYNL